MKGKYLWLMEDEKKNTTAQPYQDVGVIEGQSNAIDFITDF